jgi:type II secretory pathway pseudopilin PulG
MTMTGSRGFTFIALLIVMVLGSIVVGGALSILITNQRTFTGNAATVSGQQTTRVAAEVLFAEIREISARGGDLVAIESDSLRVRMMRKFSYACSIDLTGTDPVVTVLDELFGNAGGFVASVPVMAGANGFAQNDRVLVFADNDPDILTDDVWIPASVGPVDAAATCPNVAPFNGEEAVALTFTGQMSAFTTDVVDVGAPVRSMTVYTFGDTLISGDRYLARRERAGPMVPLAGPIRAGDGLEFAYYDSLGTATTTMTDVRRVEVTIRTGSEVMNSLGQMVSDSITMLIYTRN